MYIQIWFFMSTTFTKTEYTGVRIFISTRTSYVQSSSHLLFSYNSKIWIYALLLPFIHAQRTATCTVYFFWAVRAYAFIILTSTLVLGINYFVTCAPCICSQFAFLFSPLFVNTYLNLLFTHLYILHYVYLLKNKSSAYDMSFLFIFSYDDLKILKSFNVGESFWE